MSFYFWRLYVHAPEHMPPKALWFFFFAINEYIMDEPLDRQFEWYLVILGSVVIYGKDWKDKNERR